MRGGLIYMTAEEKEMKKIVKQWSSILSDVAEDKEKGVQKLIEQVAFMEVTLKRLQDDINERGPVTFFKNGKQEMYIENPSQKSYNTMINRYTTAIDKLLSYLPKDIKEIVDDGFDSFVRERL